MNYFCAPLPYYSDASRYFAVLADMPWGAWLDSGGIARFDILTAAPHHKLLFTGDDSADQFERIRKELGAPLAAIPDVPFCGGALGFWGYDLMQRMSELSSQPNSLGVLPNLAIGIYDWALILDHHKQCANLVSHQRYPETAALLSSLLLRFKDLPALPNSTFKALGKIRSNFTLDSYAAAYATVQQYLQSGDCYQINLAQKFSVQAQGDGFGAYLTLRKLSPAPFSAYLNFPAVQILCNSPERFIHVQNGKVETRPIKGTRPRSSNAREDRLLAEALRNHPKDRAENLMIVDLLRSDLGKNCVPGSVSVPKLFELESFANVHHLVSTVEGQIAPGRDALDVFHGCFPGGSITGAPKRRAMEIIQQLEPDQRGIYCGSIGYIGFDRNMDSNIVIRTLVYADGEMHGWAGGGIVADSDMLSEYQETLAKASVMLNFLETHGAERETTLY